MFNNDDMNVDREKITRLRNSLGHGRIVSEKSFPMSIYNFKTINENEVRVEVAQEMNTDWFRENIVFIYDEFKKVMDFSKRLQPK